jgi:hypothetical protein
MAGGRRLAGARNAGLSLMELLMAIAVMGLLGVVMLILAVSTGRSFAEMVNYVDLDHYNRVALDMMTRDLRQVQYLQSFGSNTMTFIDKDGTALQYEYSSASQALTRIKDGQRKVLLDNCDSMQFAIYQRSPMSNRFDLYPVTSVTNTKVVRMTWNCSRKLFGRRINSEQAQAARIVIRNKKEI